MVFSSLEFIYLFLPPTLAGFFVLRWLGWERGIIWWLIAASLAFYAWWSVAHLALLLGSVGINYLLHKMLVREKSSFVLWLGIVGNLATLAYFKYADFLIGNMNAVAGTDLSMLGIVLPLAISFFTFQQISFLYDTYKDRIADCDFSRYMLFVVFFPQLIAGPIVLQKDTIPQFRLAIFQSRAFLNIAIGGTLFGIGLFKKIVLADGVAPMANAVFGLADAGNAVPMEAAWIGALAYTFQIYFDFSGYCDMALGLARLFGIRLPINFHSPYKSESIVEFWRRWHITLSRFLRDYLYIPLGGNRNGPSRRYVNLFATMVLGGLWHGASWNFVLWGALHGFYLTINHAWTAVAGKSGFAGYLPAPLARIVAQGLTLLAVIVAWVFFRAETFTGAVLILEGMFGLNEVYVLKPWESVLTDTSVFWMQAVGLAAICLFAPNAIELVRKYRPVIDVRDALGKVVAHGQRFMWRPSPAWSMAIFAITLTSIIQMYRLDDLTEFIYFNF
ncbi:MBOAT family protein [Pyruvatibacter sp. HU-CL02332]|uniref:MBOAT family O-acyltransferase n=1 Tax=Pyruvatibacter sp. HU-CL02332 TaxID=3127650 RepID=UPI00310903B9